MYHSLLTIIERHGSTFSKHNYEVFHKFQEFRSKLETLTKRKINNPRSENGGEYTSKELIAYSTEACIKRVLIIPYYPEKNGLDERKNRSIEEGI